MPDIEIRIPQLGEGLTEARVLRLLKQPGDLVAHDERIYEMETDKAVVEVESPVSGSLQSWAIAENTVVPIGSVIGVIRGDPPVPASGLRPESAGPEIPPAGSSPSLPVAARNAAVPPRTRAYARERGVTPADLDVLAATCTGKLMPKDIDAFLAQPDSTSTGPMYGDIPLTSRQRALVFRLARSVQVVVPATEEVLIDWSGVERARSAMKRRSRQGEGVAPTPFLLFAWCVAQVARKHPKLRSALVGEESLRVYDHLHLGIAVTSGDDELLMARVAGADTLDLATFTQTAHESIKLARTGVDQGTGVMQLSISNLAGTGLARAIPVVVAPAVGTIFLGSPQEAVYRAPGGEAAFRRVAAATLTFDHRIVNGVGAARFLADVRSLVEHADEFAVLGASGANGAG